MKILITGGHLTPALALIDFIRANHPADEIIFLGRKYSQIDEHQLSQEQQEISWRKIPFIDLPAVKGDKSNWIIFPRFLFKFIKSISVAGNILRQQRPDVIMSFGGYLALPVALAAWLQKIPIVTHEQTREPGIANYLISRLAVKIGLSFIDTTKKFPAHKVQVVGAPLRSKLFELAPTPSWWKSNGRLPLLFISGGNQGSLFINNLVIKILPELTKNFFVVHQCGNPLSSHDYLASSAAAKSKLPVSQQDNYYFQTWFIQPEQAWIYQQASVVMTRSGANTVSELASFKIPSLLIPLPNSRHQEQIKNAQWLVEQSPTKIIRQDQLQPQRVITILKELSRQPKANLALTSIKNKQNQTLADIYSLIQTASITT